jgi:hypothetical protein
MMMLIIIIMIMMTKTTMMTSKPPLGQLHHHPIIISSAVLLDTPSFFPPFFSPSSSLFLSYAPSQASLRSPVGLYCYPSHRFCGETPQSRIHRMTIGAINATPHTSHLTPHTSQLTPRTFPQQQTAYKKAFSGFGMTAAPSTPPLVLNISQPLFGNLRTTSSRIPGFRKKKGSNASCFICKSPR